MNTLPSDSLGIPSLSLLAQVAGVVGETGSPTSTPTPVQPLTTEITDLDLFPDGGASILGEIKSYSELVPALTGALSRGIERHLQLVIRLGEEKNALLAQLDVLRQQLEIPYNILPSITREGKLVNREITVIPTATPAFPRIPTPGILLGSDSVSSNIQSALRIIQSALRIPTPGVLPGLVPFPSNLQFAPMLTPPFHGSNRPSLPLRMQMLNLKSQYNRLNQALIRDTELWRERENALYSENIRLQMECQQLQETIARRMQARLHLSNSLLSECSLPPIQVPPLDIGIYQSKNPPVIPTRAASESTGSTLKRAASESDGRRFPNSSSVDYYPIAPARGRPPKRLRWSSDAQ